MDEAATRNIALRNMEQNIQLNAYPGRGIVVGLDRPGHRYIQLYWVMGRSENSRNRVMVLDNDEVKTIPFDPSKVANPDLIIYTAMRTIGRVHIVSNGVQTDSIAESLLAGGSFEAALLDWRHEPDPPLYTPRISAILEIASGQPDLRLSKIYRNPFDASESCHAFYDVRRLEPGFGVCLHTYKCDGNPPPSFDADPYAVALDGDLDEIAREYWGLLNKDNRVALVAKSIEVVWGNVEYRIINAHEGV
jgi:IMP cyclohydrolase